MSSHRQGKGEITAVRRATRSIEPRELVERVATQYGLPLNRLLHEPAYGSQAHNIAMWLLRQRGVTLHEIGAFFGGINYPALSQRIRRMEQAMQPIEAYARRAKC